MQLAAIEALIREVPDFPKPGILFKDITPLLADGAAFAGVIEHFAERYREHDLSAVVGVEARGFIFGAALAKALGVGFIPVRKPGKLPYQTVGVEYALEYGTDRVEIHVDALTASDKVVLIDDLLATGGTAAATVELIMGQGAQLEEIAFIIELGFLNGREKLAPHPVYSLFQ